MDEGESDRITRRDRGADESASAEEDREGESEEAEKEPAEV